MRSRPCRQVKREEVWEQVFACGAQTEHFIQAMQQEFYRKFRTRDAPENRAEREEKEAWEEDWDDERMTNWWYEGAAFSSAVDPAEGSDVISGSLGGGNPSTPRNGTRARNSFRSPRGGEKETKGEFKKGR